MILEWIVWLLFVIIAISAVIEKAKIKFGVDKKGLVWGTLENGLPVLLIIISVAVIPFTGYSKFNLFWLFLVFITIHCLIGAVGNYFRGENKVDSESRDEDADDNILIALLLIPQLIITIPLGLLFIKSAGYYKIEPGHCYVCSEPTNNSLEVSKLSAGFYLNFDRAERSRLKRLCYRCSKRLAGRKVSYGYEGYISNHVVGEACYCSSCKPYKKISQYKLSGGSVLGSKIEYLSTTTIPVCKRHCGYTYIERDYIWYGEYTILWLILTGFIGFLLFGLSSILYEHRGKVAEFLVGEIGGPLYDLKCRFYPFISKLPGVNLKPIEDNTDFERPKEKFFFDVLLDSICCVMCADGQMSSNEQHAVRAILGKTACPWSNEEIDQKIMDFLIRRKKLGAEQLLEQTCENLDIFKKAGKEKILLKCIDYMAQADGSIDESEIKVRKKIESALKSK